MCTIVRWFMTRPAVDDGLSISLSMISVMHVPSRCKADRKQVAALELSSQHWRDELTQKIATR